MQSSSINIKMLFSFWSNYRRLKRGTIFLSFLTCYLHSTRREAIFIILASPVYKSLGFCFIAKSCNKMKLLRPRCHKKLNIKARISSTTKILVDDLTKHHKTNHFINKSTQTIKREMLRIV